MKKTLEAMEGLDRGLVFANLVDFDQQYGHRNDVEGYAGALEEFDAWLPEFRAALRPDDLAILTADHGCDPTTPSTDHSREYTPLLAFGPQARGGVDLGLRGTLSDIGQTVAAKFCNIDRERDQLFKRNQFMRTPLMAGNWKMYKTPAETQAFFDAFLPLVAGATGRDAAICPPYIDLAVALAATAGSNVGIGAQNLAAGKEGAMTGEISGHMLKTIGVQIRASSATANAASFSARTKPGFFRRHRQRWNTA